MNSDDDTLAGGLPHSEIPGSPIARISPGLFAACHVLHRLSVPRHPPDALVSRLIKCIAVTGDATTAAHRAKPQRNPQGQPLPFPQPRDAAVSHEDTSLRHTPGPALLAPPPTGEARLRRNGRANTLAPGLSASVTSQLSLYPSISPTALTRGGCRHLCQARHPHTRQTASAPVVPVAPHRCPCRLARPGALVWVLPVLLACACSCNACRWWR